MKVAIMQLCELGGKGHDVVAVAEVDPSADDDDVLLWAARERRILLTEDKDFGQLVFAQSRTSAGIVFLRYPAPLRRVISSAVVEFVQKHGSQISGYFVVIEPDRIRIRKPPR